MSSSKAHCAPRYRLLSNEQILDIHRLSLEILETVGVRVKHEQGIRNLLQAGCCLKDDDVVLVPASLVEECIESAPSCVTIYDRNAAEAMRLTANNSYFGLGTDLLKTYDLETGELRPSCLQDVINAARVVQGCPEIDFCASYALPQDVPTNSMYIESFKAQVENTTKPIFFTAAARDDLQVIVEMASIVAGSEARLRDYPFIIHYAETQSPLTHTRSGVEKLFLCADKRIPVNYTQGMLMGASGPVTLAGAIALANAEALSGVVLHQTRARGAPIVTGLAVVPLDMRTTVFSYGAPEYRLTDAAYADLYHYYGLPMWGTAGCSDSNILDQQAAAEAAISILMSIHSGANLIHDVGYLGQGLIGNPAAIVMCNELIAYARRVMRGFDVDAETVPIELIKHVGPGGTYLAERHTVRFHRQEFWHPVLFNRQNPDTWTEQDGQDFGRRALERAKQVLATIDSQPLPETTSRQLAAIAVRAGLELAGRPLGT